MTVDKPKLLIIAGPNGSGKTSVTSKILEHQWIEDCVYTNPDNIAQDVFGDWLNMANRNFFSEQPMANWRKPIPK